MLREQYKILLEFKEPVNYSYWNKLISLIKKPKNDMYIINNFEEYIIDDYKCIYFIVTPKMEIDEYIIKKPLIPLLQDINKEKNLNAQYYYKDPYSDLYFFEASITVSVV